LSFDEKVYEVVDQIPEGKVTTYKVLARKVEMRGGYQAIGQALKRNPDAPEVPCHRVVKADGTVGGYAGSLHGEHVDEKRRLLEQEGIEIEKGKVKNFEDRLWTG
jgi:O-6-methylguanine DNA methyltransferase